MPNPGLCSACSVYREGRYPFTMKGWGTETSLARSAAHACSTACLSSLLRPHVTRRSPPRPLPAPVLRPGQYILPPFLPSPPPAPGGFQKAPLGAPQRFLPRNKARVWRLRRRGAVRGGRGDFRVLRAGSGGRSRRRSHVGHGDSGV